MAVQHTLSKSDFKLGADCWAKLYYKKLGYLSTTEEDSYLGFLAEGGYLIGAVAKLVVPGGIDVQQDVRQAGLGYRETTQRALARTRELLQYHEVTLYEPAFQVGKRIVRVDILVKNGINLDLIEVKSKSQDGRDVKWGNEWHPYLDDVAYQLTVVRADRPDCRVVPWLMTPDKSHVSMIDHLTSHFQLRELGMCGSFRDVEIDFNGGDILAKQIRESGLLRRWNIEALIEERLAGVELAALAFEAWLGASKLEHPDTAISKNCFRCEYDTADGNGRNGFHECWGDLGKADRHIRHLYRVGSLGGWQNPKANQWIDERRVHHDDLTEEDLLNGNGELGVHGQRILIQIAHTNSCTEWLDATGLRAELEAWRYPLHFIDFEASSSPLPYHQGMRPYQTVAFQWSCHTIREPGAEPTHQEFLNTTARHPALEFLQSLQAAIGNHGTALMWSTYERTQLKNLQAWISENSDCSNEGLMAWVDALIRTNPVDAKPTAPRLVDQHALVPKSV